MLPYWLLFSLWAAGAVQAERRAEQTLQPVFFVAACVVTTLMVGLRFQVGGDWGAYQRIYEDIYFLALPEALGTTDPGYATLNWLGVQFGLGIGFVNTICATIFMVGVGRLAWKQPNPSLAMLIAVPYLVIVVAMGYTRQAAAIGLICLAVADASETKILKLVLLSGFAALFHKTAILILPLLLVPVLRRNVIYGAIGALAFIAVFVVLLRDASDELITNYVNSSYDSQGATIRVAMTVVPGVIFLIFRDRFVVPKFQKSFWAVSALASILLVAALAASAASSGVDRMSLYFIPLQFFVYSRLPFIFGQDGKALPSVLLGVIAYCVLIQFVWLNYADNANYWLPYSLNI